MGDWKAVPIDSKLFENVDETVLRRANAAIENAFINEAGGHTRFPGLREFCTIPGNAPVHVNDWRGDLLAVSNSRVYRIDKNGVKTDVTGVPLSGMGRPIFDETTNEKLITAGAQILRLANGQTEILSEDAPLSTHVGFIDSFVLAIEVGSGRFNHCGADDFRVWDPIDTFSANGKPDNLNAMVITPYREILMTGVDSVEQFERLSNGSTPFFRRWSNGEGIIAPYTLVAADQGTFGFNKVYEYVRMTGQVSDPTSYDVGRTFEKVDDWTDAWAVEIALFGQRFILVQIPFATNAYGTKGLTMLYEYRAKKWHTLYGWDQAAASPSRWPGWSYFPLWGRHFVGGTGKVLELVKDLHTNDGVVQRMLGRTAHLDEWGEAEVSNVRARLKRGAGGSNDENPPMFGLRAIKDNRSVTRTRWKSLGRSGDTDMVIEFGGMGSAHTWQFEWVATDNVPVELVKLEAMVERIGA